MAAPQPSSASELCLHGWALGEEQHICKRYEHGAGTHLCMCGSQLLWVPAVPRESTEEGPLRSASAEG
ncbi:hypothetical protein HOT31_gp026 [Microbacterium phage Hendrix]|uniref:Uncharacterized protein n=1 Tax=Microbacterium phage Hendrix TaxID=2182341 RepID=A0A2U8UUE3_9CAUD|nr:hypothetical protein HOT31_gp026 [Microbacterium phage Hendrix]AWN07697.1 hypothetical protein PBI_HENDRIX_26 [Microbacterium phage Hendrix]